MNISRDFYPLWIIGQLKSPFLLEKYNTNYKKYIKINAIFRCFIEAKHIRVIHFPQFLSFRVKVYCTRVESRFENAHFVDDDAVIIAAKWNCVSRSWKMLSRARLYFHVTKEATISKMQIEFIVMQRVSTVIYSYLLRMCT